MLEQADPGLSRLVEEALSEASRAPSGARILQECLRLATFLCKKNVNYGNSALNPMRVFSRASPVEQIRVRLDDKLSRLSRGAAAGEDTVKDLLGYLILLRIGERDSGNAQVPSCDAADADRSVRDRSPGRTGGRRQNSTGQADPEEREQLDGNGKHCRRFGDNPVNACQECGDSAPPGLAVCRVCYERRWKQQPREV